MVSSPTETGTTISARDQLTVRRILKVNHAGEYGAIRIYRAQIAVSKRLCPDVTVLLAQMLEHEISHCEKFRSAMPSRRARPCRIMSLWGWGGALLGWVTAILGRRMIWITTAAVESTVHRHLDDQLRFLAHRDHELFQLIDGIRDEELSHLRTAEAEIEQVAFLEKFARLVISAVIEVLIWLSTWGDSTRLARDLAASRLV